MVALGLPRGPASPTMTRGVTRGDAVAVPTEVAPVLEAEEGPRRRNGPMKR
jgi:hypothetical protein